MSRVDSLPADQRAVLQLLLQRGSRYDELASLLSIDEAEVRRRAHGALEALAADTPGPADDRRAQISDYLLGQQSGEERAATRGFLEGSAGARAWAQAVAAELRDVAGDRLPDVPAEAAEPGEPADAPGGGAGAVAARAEAEREAAAAATAGPTVTDASAAAAAFGAAPAAREDPASGDPRAGAPRVSRRTAALLLGGLLLAAVVVVLVFVVRDSGDSPKTAAPAAGTPAATTQPKVVAQANLVPPTSRRGSKALGVVLVQRVSNQQQIVAAAQGLPKAGSGGYGIWLYTSPARARWLGFFASQDRQGRLLARGVLNGTITDYREVLVTREARRDPARPGPIFLRGPIRAAGGAGG